MSEDRPTALLQGAAIGRRSFMFGLAGSLLVGLGLRAAAARGGPGPLYVACRADESGRYLTTGFRADGRRLFDLPLPGRGHDLALRPASPECVVFARRPGRFAVVIDVDQGVVVRRIDAAADRHFYGHGSFTPDGRYLLSSENDYAGGRGTIGVRDATDDYRQVGELPSHGIGPHEVVLMRDGKTLAVANGGVRTHPDRDRAKLNLDSMQPSLTYLEIASGREEAAVRPPARLHQLGIRHVAVNPHGLVAVAMQYEGSKRDQVPLVGLHAGGELRLLAAPEKIQRRMRHYTGAIAFDPSGEVLAVSSPRGNLFTFWDAAAGTLIDQLTVFDGCGLSAAEAPGAFLVTGGGGEVIRIEPRTGARQVLTVAGVSGTPWDNHVRASTRPSGLPTL
jgi:hypothetical protein